MNVIEVPKTCPYVNTPPQKREDAIQDIALRWNKANIRLSRPPPGAGKKHPAKILTGTLRNYRGSVRVFGKEMKRRTSGYGEQIGVDFEFPNFYENSPL